MDPQRRFPAGEFTRIPDVPVFKEHVTKAQDGRELKFTPRELQAVVDRCNRRIQETGDFAAITLGHTPDPKAIREGRANMPAVVGFCGPFKLGRMPDGSAGIFADFWVYTKKVECLKQYPRRSPELWLEDRYEDMFLDPIALLGAEAPRLDLGLLYSAERQGRLVEKYAAVSPGAMNSFLPEHTKPKSYAAASGTSAMISPEDVKQIVDAIRATDEWQFLANLKAEQDGGMGSDDLDQEVPVEAPTGDTEQYEPEDDAPLPDLEDEAGAVEDVPDPAAAPSAPPPVREEDKKPEPMARRVPKKPMPVKRFQAAASVDGAATTAAASVDGESTTGQAASSYETAKSPYSKPGARMNYAREFQTLREDYSRLNTELQKERQLRIDAERMAELEHLVNVEGYQLNVEKEFERVRYGKANDEQAKAHFECIRENYQRAPIGMDLPLDHNVLRMTRPGTGERYSKATIDKAFAIAEKAAIKGEDVDFPALCEKIESGAA